MYLLCLLLTIPFQFLKLLFLNLLMTMFSKTYKYYAKFFEVSLLGVNLIVLSIPDMNLDMHFYVLQALTSVARLSDVCQLSLVGLCCK